MDLTSPLTRTAAGIARRALVPPLTVLDQRVVVPVLGAKHPVHRVLAAVAGATAATTAAPNPSPAPSGPASPSPSPAPSADTDEAPDGAAADAEPGELTEDEQERIERLTDQLLAEQDEANVVGELADDELRRAQARIRAKQIIEEEDGRLGEDDGS